MIRADTRLTPAMSTTEYIIVTSTAPTYGRVSPDATVETISFGTPTGSARIAARRDRRAARAAEREDAVEPALGVQLRARPARRPAAIAVTAAPRSPAAASSRDVRARPRRARCPARADRLVHAGVDDEHVDAVLEQPVAEERVLDALRVERAEQDDGRHYALLRERLDAEEAALQLRILSTAPSRSSRRRSSPPPSRAGARRSTSPRRGSARSAGSRAPPRSSFLNVSTRCSMIAGASPSDGSSMIRSVGFVSSARAIASICCSPPESCAPPFRLRSRSRGKSSYARSTVQRFEPPRARDHPQVLVDGERREEPAPLRHVADAELRDLVRRLADELAALVADRAGDARRRHADDRVAERRLAHAVAADDRRRAAGDLERDVLERLRAPVERVDALDREQRRQPSLWFPRPR